MNMSDYLNKLCSSVDRNCVVRKFDSYQIWVATSLFLENKPPFPNQSGFSSLETSPHTLMIIYGVTNREKNQVFPQNLWHFELKSKENSKIDICDEFLQFV